LSELLVLLFFEEITVPEELSFEILLRDFFFGDGFETTDEPSDETSDEPSSEVSSEPSSEVSSEPFSDVSSEPSSEFSSEVFEFSDCSSEFVTSEPSLLVFSVSIELDLWLCDVAFKEGSSTFGYLFSSALSFSLLNTA
jgi:hypothetical protein